MTHSLTKRVPGLGNERPTVVSRQTKSELKKAQNAAVKLNTNGSRRCRTRERKSSLRLQAAGELASERPFRNATSPKQNKSLLEANKGQRQ
jgi:hypothetical protein